MKLKHLWAPWRLEYIKSNSQKNALHAQDCPFCALPKETPSERNLLLYSDDQIFIVMNKFPYNPSHLLVVPRTHAQFPHELPAGMWNLLARAQELCLQALKENSQPQAFNIGINLGSVAGAGIADHLHWHIVPRWFGDTNFMPVIAETKALPTHNETVWRQLIPHFKDFQKKLYGT